MIAIDTPAHVQYAPRIENGIRVQGGTNYDIGRGGVSTPVVKLPEPPKVMPVPQVAAPLPLVIAKEQTAYEPKHNIPEGAPNLVLTFPRNGAALTAEMKKQLAQFKPTQLLVIVGHADSEETAPATAAKNRAKVVAQHFKKARISRVVSFSDTLTLGSSETAAERNRRVEIFVAPTKAP